MSAPVDRAEMLYRRVLADGRELVVYPQFFGTARLCIGGAEASWIDDSW